MSTAKSKANRDAQQARERMTSQSAAGESLTLLQSVEAYARVSARMNERTVKRPVAKKKATPMKMLVVSFAETEEWSAWLASRHHSSIGVWIKIAKKASEQASITYAEALDVALAWGWIDAQKGKFDEAWWLQ
jgi:hypothetical protein